MKLSLVIPVYNVERHVEKCLRSCEAQDIPPQEYEIIVVNDGSNDGSMAVVERVAGDYANIRILSQENQGLSMARNNGLKEAKGEYVWFIDSDDWIAENCLGGICDKLKNRPDLLQLQYCCRYEDSSKDSDGPRWSIDGMVSGKKQMQKGGLPQAAQYTIYRIEFLRENHLSFFPGIYHEDSEFKPRALYFAKSVCSYDRVVYAHNLHEGDRITSCFRLKNGMDLLTVCNSLNNFVDKHGLKGTEKRYFYGQIATNLNQIFIGIRELGENDRLQLLGALGKNRHLFRKMYASGKTKYQIESVFFMSGIRFGLFAHRMFKS